MTNFEQLPLDFSTPPQETPQERGIRRANEDWANAERASAADPSLVEPPSADNREMYLPHVSVEPVTETPDKNNLGKSNDTPNPDLDYAKRIIEHVNPATQDPALRNELRLAEIILRNNGLRPNK
jgi:hypothetical protein